MAKQNKTASGDTLTLKKLTKLFKEASKITIPRYSGYFRLERTSWLVWWVRKLMFWKYKEIVKHILIKKSDAKLR